MGLQTVYTVRDGLDGSVGFAHSSFAECKRWVLEKRDCLWGDYIIDIWEFGKVIGKVELDYLDPLDFTVTAKIWKTTLFEDVKV